jgi:hypothetical protein
MSARGAHIVGPTSVPANDEVDQPSGLRDLGRFVRLLAPLLAKELVPLLPGGDRVRGADVSPRPSKEEEKWRSEVEGSGSSDPIQSEGSGESSWSLEEAREIVASIRRKKKRGR